MSYRNAYDEDMKFTKRIIAGLCVAAFVVMVPLLCVYTQDAGEVVVSGIGAATLLVTPRTPGSTRRPRGSRQSATTCATTLSRSIATPSIHTTVVLPRVPV